MALFTAWHTARLSVFHKGKLGPLPDELEKLRPKVARQQTSEEILEAMRAIRATMGAASDKPQPA